MKDEPEVVFPEQDHPSDVEVWPEDGVMVMMRVGSFGLTVELSSDEARRLGLAFPELAERAAATGHDDDDLDEV